MSSKYYVEILAEPVLKLNPPPKDCPQSDPNLEDQLEKEQIVPLDPNDQIALRQIKSNQETLVIQECTISCPGYGTISANPINSPEDLKVLEVCKECYLLFPGTRITFNN